MTQKEKIEIYYKAKEAYYNGHEIMTDFEFDALEKELGLENKSEIGSRHNPSYTIKHPYIMGSLSKVQIHKDKEGNIDWEKYFNEAQKYFGNNLLIITPKYDGCSFEVVVENDKIQSISSRGDGTWGKDLMNHLVNFIPSAYVHLDGHYTLRGEVLIKKSVFEQKYSEKFTNPRSFVSGVLNRDYSVLDKEFMEMLNDLSIVIYDYRKFENGNWIDHEWTELPKSDIIPKRYWFTRLNDVQNFAWYYDDMNQYRHESCEFALDGIVIKPIVKSRENNTAEHRPKDCVAIKFIPMLEETEVTNITWNLGKTGELIPIVWVKPVVMDGRMIQKCSGHNYGYLLEKKVSIGSKIIMSLAGDIIPFLYKVTNTDNFDETKMNIPDNTYIDGDIHLMKILSDKDWSYVKFINSATGLNIPNIGNETAKKIFDYLTKTDSMTAEFFGDEEKELKYNILMCTPEEIYYGAGSGKTGSNAQKAFKEVLKNLTLVDIITSCNFRFCGKKVAEQCANYLLSGDANFEHLAAEGYTWVYDETSTQRNQINEILNSIGRTIEDFKAIHKEKKQEASNQIPIIMTGEPNNYSTKQEFLDCHPEYRNTTSWKEVQIVFTNSLDSNTGKMKKAREKNIEIKLY